MDLDINFSKECVKNINNHLASLQQAFRLEYEKILTNYLQRQAVAQKLNRETHAVENALKHGAQVCEIILISLDVNHSKNV